MGAAVRQGVPLPSRRTELAVGSGGAVAAAKTATGVGVADLGWPPGVSVAAAVTRDTRPRIIVEASAAPVAVRATVRGEAGITHCGAAGV